MSDFFTKKPVSQAEFDEAIKKMSISYENNLADQKERIFSLVDENKRLNAEIRTLKDKDEQISKALLMALSKAKEIEDAAKLRYEMEIERLKIFHSKWIAYYSEVKNKLPANEGVISSEAFLAEMDRILGFNSPVFKNAEHDAKKQFESESRRLNLNDESMPSNKTKVQDIDKIYAAADNSIAATLKDDEESGLDMQEVLSPKNLPDLEQLIKQMNILNK